MNYISPFLYPNCHDFVRAYALQDENKYLHNWHYFRGGSPNLAAIENHVATLAGVNKGHLILTTSGMSAFVTALEIANLNTNDIIIHGSIEYGQIYNYFNADLKEKGVITIEVNPNNNGLFEKSISQAVKKYSAQKIKVIFLETIGNGPAMPVLDIEKFLSLKIVKTINPIIILDNTLPTDSIIPLGKIIKKSGLKIIGLESTTKFYLKNQDLGGLLFTYTNELLQQLLTKRKRIGATPGPSLIKQYKQLLPQTKEQFDAANRIIMFNTFLLSDYCKKAKGYGKKFAVGYPQLPAASAPVFFLTSKSNNINSEKLFYSLEETGALKDILITESFGFTKTSVSYSPRLGGYVRFAGGLEPKSDIIALGKHLQRALTEIYS